MSTLRAAFLITFPLAVIAVCGVGAIAIWAYFASGDCSMWVINQILMRDSVVILGSDYYPECTGGLRTAWAVLTRLALVCVLASAGVVFAMNLKRSAG